VAVLPVILVCCGLPAYSFYDTVLGEQLVLAAEEGDENHVRFLIGMHVNVNFEHEDGDTALACAARENRREVVRILLAYGADPLKPGKQRLLPSQLTDDPEIIKMLSKSGD
jgi:ankyrin repeat protein